MLIKLLLNNISARSWQYFLSTCIHHLRTTI